MSKRLAWSYSALSVWRTCRKKFYHLRIAKDVKDGDSEAAAEGKAVHDAMFQRVIKGTKLPIRMRQHERVCASYAERGKLVDDIQGEMKLCLNDKLDPVDWFAKDAWVRAIVDLLLVKGKVAILVDWKTGKRRDDFEQLELSAAILSRYMPEIEEFHLVFEWLRDGVRSSPETGPLRKADMKKVWMKHFPTIEEIEEAAETTSFPATPSGLCGWCPVESCPHWFDRSER